MRLYPVEKVAEDGYGYNPPQGSPVRWEDPPSSETSENAEIYRTQGRVQLGLIGSYEEYIDDRKTQLENGKTVYIVPVEINPRYQVVDHTHWEPEEWNTAAVHVVFPDPRYFPKGPAPCGKDIARDMLLSGLFTALAFTDPESPPIPIAAVLPGHGMAVVGSDRESTNHVILHEMTLRKPIGV